MKAIVYLPLKPEFAKERNLPVKLPILVEDLPLVSEKNSIPLDVIIRGLEAQVSVKDDGYYSSYLVYFYYEKVKELVSKGEFERALEFVEKAGKVVEDYRYHFYRGIVLEKMGKDGEAEVELRISTGMKPDFSLAYYELGKILMKNGEFEDAERMFETASSIDADFVLPVVKLGDVALSKGDLSKALSHYEKALEKDPNLPDVYNRLGVIHNELQRFDDAERFFKKALEIYPDFPDALYNLSYTLVKKGKIFSAFEILSNLEKRFSDDVRILNELGIVSREIGLFERSVEVLERAFEISREDWVGYNLVRSLCLVDIEKAFEMAEKLENVEVLETVEWYSKKIEPKFSKSIGEWIEIIDECEDLMCVLDSIEVEGKIGKRLKRIRRGGIPIEDTDFDTSEFLDLVVAYFSRANNVAEMEKRSIEIAVALYGSGTMLGVVRTLLRLFQSKFTEGFVGIETVKNVIEEIKDLDWNLAIRLSRAIENPNHSGESKGSDFVVSLISSLFGGIEAEGTVKDFVEILEG